MAASMQEVGVHPVVRRLAAGAAVVAGTVAVVTGLGAVGQTGAALDEAPPVFGGPVVGDTTPEQLSRAFRRAAERSLPGVVHVQVQAVRPARIEVPEPFRGTPWEELFRRGQPSPESRQGSGSGFVFRPDGYILTNNHVIEGAERVTVVLQDRREFEARVVGRDPNTDVAVLKIDAENLPVVELGESEAVAVGDWVVALGYPLRLGATATAGIVSAKGRRLGIIGQDEEASAPLEHFIQTDAAINPGNSGGPLVDLDGRAIGINTAIASPTGYYSGYGFAVPIDLAKRVAEDLLEHGAVRRPKLGVAIDDVGPADREVYRLDRAAGAEVKRVEEGGPAARAGLRLGDVIVAVDGHPVESSGDLMELLALKDPNDTVELDVVRYGERLRIRVELGTFEPAVTVERDTGREKKDALSRLGFTASELTPALARRLGVEARDGVVVTRVEEASPAARAGLRPGAVIESVNGREVADVSDLNRATRALRDGQAVSLVIILPDGTRTIVNYRLRG
ncbi:MAG TPA: trypsin-like peptidase domain-containing protein [Longimicrobiales bacterium]